MATARGNRTRSTKTSARAKRATAVSRRVAEAVGGERVDAPAVNRVTRVRRKLDMTQQQFGRVLGVSTRKVAELEGGGAPSPVTRRRITEVERLQREMATVVEPDSIGPWMERPNAAFGGRRPIQVIEDGEIDLLWAMVYHLRSGNPS